MVKNLKLPPQDIEAERSVLGSLMLDKNAIIKIADILAPSDFYQPHHQKIYESVIDLFEAGEPIDVLTVANRLKEKKELKLVGGESYLTELIEAVPTAAHIVHYANIVRENRVRRDLIAASSEINEKALENNDFEALLDQVEQRVFDIAGRSRTQKFIHIKDELAGAYERLEKLHQGGGEKLRGVPTHFRGLDNILSGLQKSDLIIVGARPSFGKTAFVLDIARQAALAGHSVGVFSLEMSRDQIIDRILATQAQIPLWRLRTGRLEGETEFALIQAALDEISKSKLFIDDSPSPNILQMRSMARRLQIEQGLDLLVVDYLQLIRPRTDSDSMVQQVTEISRGLKSLARELNIPIIAVSQLSRAVDQREGKVPRLSDLRESGCLTGDTLVTLATGAQVAIQSLVERDIKEPVKVLAIDDDYKIRPHLLRRAFASGKKQVFKLTTRTGRTIKASANHPFLQLGGWRRLKDLKIGDTVGLPRQVRPAGFSNPLTESELILLAHLLGDGCILPRQAFHYTSASAKNIGYVRENAKKLFGIEGRLVKQKNWYHLYLPSPYHLTRGKFHPLSDWFKKLGIKKVRPWQKQISPLVFQCNEERLALFLKHLWSTDGNVSWKRLPNRKPAGNIYYATSSEVMSRQVQHLLLRLGIQSSLRTVPSRKGYRNMYHIYVEGRTHQLSFLKMIGVADEREKNIPAMIRALENITPNPNIDIIPKQIWEMFIKPAKEAAGMSWRNFANSLDVAYCGSALFKSGLSRQRMARLNTILLPRLEEKRVAPELAQTLRHIADSDIFWDQIVSIEPLGIEEVYDLTVEGAHNFVANDFVVHNSLEQDADVVLFLYRKDRGVLDAPEEEQNLVEIIVAKHRNGPLGTVKLRFDPEKVSFRNIDTQHTEI